MTIGRIPSVEGGIQPTIFDAKGDILAASAADTPARLAVGSNETRLVAASGETTGLKWVADTTNYAIAAKGDLLAGSAADTVTALTVGANGESLVADSSTTTGLRWQADWNTGKNKIINGDFAINQRGFTSTTATNTFTFDRWQTDKDGGTATYTAQTFTPGSAPVAGYESTNFVQIVTASQSNTTDYAAYRQSIEDVRTFAGQTVTFSFWAKASTGTPKVGTCFVQNFGSGGSSAVITKSGDVTISSSWARYSVTIAIPSVSGKTIGTSSYLRTFLFTSAGTGLSSYTDIGLQNATIQIWGVQVEAGSVATPFTTATGTLAGELAACQRYYVRFDGVSGNRIGIGYNETTTVLRAGMHFPVEMRIAPTALEQSGTASNYSVANAGANTTCSSVPVFFTAIKTFGVADFTVSSGLTAGQGAMMRFNGTAYLGWSAEL